MTEKESKINFEQSPVNPEINDEEQKEFFAKEIDNIIRDFEHREIEQVDLREMESRLMMLKDQNSDLFNRSWSKNQVKKIIQAMAEADIQIDTFFLSRFFTTNHKAEDEKNTISDVTARAIVDVLQEGETVPHQIQESLGIWFQNIQMIAPEDRIDLVFSLIDNPGLIHKQITQEAIINMAFYGSALLEDLYDYYNKNKNDIIAHLKIIEILEFLQKLNWVGYEKGRSAADELINLIYNEDNNYFVRNRLKLSTEQKTEKVTNCEPLPEGVYALGSRFSNQKRFQDRYNNACGLRRISPGYYAIYNPFGDIDSFIEQGEDGAVQSFRPIKLQEIFENSGMFFSDKKDLQEREKMYQAFKALQHPTFLRQVESDFDINLSELNIRNQLQFLNFILTKSTEEVGNIIDFTKKHGLDSLAAFVYCEYGEEIGEKILNIGEKLPQEISADIFAEFRQISNLTSEISVTLSQSEELKDDILPTEVKKYFPTQAAEAIMRRAKDIIYTADQLSDKGKAEAQYHDGTTLEITKVSQIVEALRQYRQSIEIIKNLISTGDNDKEFILLNAETGVPTSYQFEVKNSGNESSYLTIQLREVGAQYKDRNANREFDGEARINFLFSNQPMSLDLTVDSRQQAFSVRIDREGKDFDKDGNIIFNDPTRQDGNMSMDVGSPQDTTGRVIAIGNALSFAESKQADKRKLQFYHNRESFNHELGDADVFAKIVMLLQKKIEEAYSRAA